MEDLEESPESLSTSSPITAAAATVTASSHIIAPVSLTINARTALQIYREQEDMQETVSGFNELPAEFTLPYRIYSTEEILKASLEIVEKSCTDINAENDTVETNKIVSEHEMSVLPTLKRNRDRFAVSTLHTCVDYLSLLISYIPLHVRSQFIRTVEINYDALVRVLTLYGHDSALLEQIKQLAEAKTPARFISTSMLSDLEQVFIQLEKEHRQLAKSAGVKVEILRRTPVEKTNGVRKGVEAQCNLSLSHLEETCNNTLNVQSNEYLSAKVNNVYEPHAGVVNKKYKLEAMNSNIHTASGSATEHILESTNNNNVNNDDKENNHISSNNSSKSSSSNISINNTKNNNYNNTCYKSITNDAKHVYVNSTGNIEKHDVIMANNNKSTEEANTSNTVSLSPSKEMWVLASNRARSPRHAQDSKTEYMQEQITNSLHQHHQHHISPSHVIRLTSPESQKCVIDSRTRKRSRSREQQGHNSELEKGMTSSQFTQQDNVMLPNHECAAFVDTSQSTEHNNCNGVEAEGITESPSLLECAQVLPSNQSGSRESRKQRRKGVRTAAAAASLYAWNRPRTLTAAEKKVVLALQQLVQLLAHVYATKYNNMTPIFEYMLAACEAINGMIEKERAHFASKEKQKPPEPFHEIKLDALVENIQSSYQTFRTDEECRYEFDEDLIHPIAHALLTVMNAIEGYETKLQEPPSEEEQAKKMAKRAAARAKRDEAARKAAEKAQLRDELASRKEHERQVLRERLQLDVPDLQSLEDDLALSHSSQCGYVQYDHVTPTNSNKEFEQILFI